ncbi:MAG: segregation/condensation protein A [Cyanobium sp.]
MADAGARLAIRLLQDAAVRGEIDPWDVDVIGVIDGFLDQLRQRITLPRLAAAGGSYEVDLAESSEAFLAASVLVGLKAEVLEASTLTPEPMVELEDPFCAEETQDQGGRSGLPLPRRPERHLLRRPVAPPPLQRPVTLGELIRQLEEIAERLDNDTPRQRPRSRSRGYSDREAIAQVSALAHREKLPETTAALSMFLGEWPASAEGRWLSFEQLAGTWAAGASFTADDLDRDRVGVFWALLFLSAQGRLELRQEGGLYGALQLRLLMEEPAGQVVNLPMATGSDGVPAREEQAA